MPPPPPRFHEYRVLWRLMAGFRLRYAAALAALGVGTAVGFALPLIVGFTIDHVINQNPPPGGWLHNAATRWLGPPAGWGDRLGLIGLAVIGLTGLAGAFLFFEGLWSNRAAEGIARRLRNFGVESCLRCKGCPGTETESAQRPSPGFAERAVCLCRAGQIDARTGTRRFSPASIRISPLTTGKSKAPPHGPGSNHGLSPALGQRHGLAQDAFSVSLAARPRAAGAYSSAMNPPKLGDDAAWPGLAEPRE